MSLFDIISINIFRDTSITITRNLPDIILHYQTTTLVLFVNMSKKYKPYSATSSSFADCFDAMFSVVMVLFG